MSKEQFSILEDFIKNSKNHAIEVQTFLTAHKALAPESGGDGELKKCEALQHWLFHQGLDLQERYDAPDSRVSSGIRPNLVVTVPGKNQNKNLWIMAHMDVVPEGELDLWSSDPWKVVEKDGKLYGRGVEDNQQGMVSGILAALSFVKNNIQPELTLKLLFVADEEVGSVYGIQYLLANHSLFNKDDIIIIPDSGDSEGKTIEVAEKNIFWARFVTKGKQTHGSRPDNGINAFLANCTLALEINKLEKKLKKRNKLFEPSWSTLQPTKKEANVPNINTIPGEDVFYVDCRILPCYNLEYIRNRINACIAKVERKYGVSISYSEEQAVESPATSETAPVVTELKTAISKIYGVSAYPIGIGGGTVASYLRNAGYSAAVWSRLEETAHQPNENCNIESIIGDAQVFAYIAL